MDEGPKLKVEHLHSHHHVHHFVDEFERTPETHAVDHHGSPAHMPGRKGIPNHETYTSDKTSILKRPLG